MARIRPIAVTGHIDAPTFEKVLAACQKRKSYATVTVRNGMTVRCRVEVKGNVATIFFDLIDLGTNFSTEAEAHFAGKHKPYLRANIKKFTGAKSPFYSNFGKTSIHFHVLDTDAPDWFDEIYQALLDPANFTEIETGFGTLDQKIRAMLKGEPSDEPETALSRHRFLALERMAHMPATKSRRAAATTPRRPEQKYGPFAGGTGVAVWLNEVQTDAGPRFYRSVTIAPRRYKDPKTDEWKDAGSFRSTDLPALILALKAAQEFMSSTPLPGQPVEEEQPDPDAPADNGNIPF